jgi:hypothetical protein
MLLLLIIILEIFYSHGGGSGSLLKKAKHFPLSGSSVRDSVIEKQKITVPATSVVLSLSDDVIKKLKESTLPKNEKGHLIEDKGDIESGEEPKPLLVNGNQMNPKAKFGLKFFEVLRSSKIIVSVQELSFGEYKKEMITCGWPVKYFAALKNAKLESSVLRLPDNMAFWDGSKWTTNGLFIRRCYDVLVELLLSEESKKNAWTITGTPGIGKSCFGFYLHWKLLQLKKVCCGVFVFCVDLILIHRWSFILWKK